MQPIGGHENEAAVKAASAGFLIQQEGFFLLLVLRGACWCAVCRGAPRPQVAPLKAEEGSRYLQLEPLLHST